MFFNSSLTVSIKALLKMIMKSIYLSEVPQNGYMESEVEKGFKMFTDIFLVVMFETTGTTGVKQD